MDDDDAARLRAELLALGRENAVLKAADSERRAREEKAWSLLAAMGDLIFEFDATGCFVRQEAPPAAAELVVPPEDFAGKRPEEVLPPPVGARVAAAVAEALDGHDQQLEYMLETANGHRWYFARLSPVTVDGRVEGAIGVIRDVTDRRVAESAQFGLEAALVDLERRGRSLIESSPMGIHLYDMRTDGELVFVGANPAADRILGVDHGQFVGRTLGDAFPGLVGTELPERYSRAAANGETWHSQVVRYADERISGAYEVYAFQTTPGSMASLFLDVGPRLKAEQDRAALEARLRHQQKLESIGTLAAGVAHEINNPLNGILNYGELLQSRLPEGDPLRRYAQSIVHESERVSEIVRDLLAFARQDKQQHSPARLVDIVNSTLTLVRALFRRDQIQIQVDVRDGLPSLKCRSQQIQQVLLNLLTNARDALNDRYPAPHPDKRISLRVSPLEREGRRWLRTTVEDRGNGIPGEIAERVFDPFFTTKPRETGTGLGLAVSYGIVREHHGELSFESRPGEGTRFHLDLPVDNGWEREPPPQEGHD